MSATGGRAGNDNRIKLNPEAGKEQSFPAWGGFAQHFENFAESGEINFEDFVFFGEKNLRKEIKHYLCAFKSASYGTKETL